MVQKDCTDVEALDDDGDVDEFRNTVKAGEDFYHASIKEAADLWAGERPGQSCSGKLQQQLLVSFVSGENLENYQVNEMRQILAVIPITITLHKITIPVMWVPFEVHWLFTKFINAFLLPQPKFWKFFPPWKIHKALDSYKLQVDGVVSFFEAKCILRLISNTSVKTNAGFY